MLVKNSSIYTQRNGHTGIIYDHTNADKNKGYLFLCDPASDSKVVYQIDLSGICQDMNLTLSAWFTSLNGPNASAGQMSPKIGLKIIHVNTSGAETVLTQTPTIDLGFVTDATFKWRQQQISFIAPANINIIRFIIENKELSSNGNDWALDDIEVRLVTSQDIKNPMINNISATTYNLQKESEVINFQTSYQNDGTFSTSLYSSWIYSKTGDFEDLNAWNLIDLKQVNVAIGANVDHSLTLVNAKEGYYRRIISNTSNGYKTNCKIGSDIFHLIKNY